MYSIKCVQATKIFILVVLKQCEFEDLENYLKNILIKPLIMKMEI